MGATRWIAALLAGGAMLGWAGSASAADLRLKRPVAKAPPAAVYNWTGFYVGGHFGHGWADNNFFDVVAGSTAASFTAEGILGGGQIGINWQTGPWVVGGELEGSFAHVQRGVLFCGFGFGGFGCGGGSICTFGPSCAGQGQVICTFGPNCFGQVGARIEHLGLLSARLGYAFDRWLAFVKGGAAVAHDKYVLNVSGVLSTIQDDTRWGWTVGAGLEYGLTSNWSLKVEYDFIDLGTQRITFAAPGGLAFVFDHTQHVHLAKLGINYRW